MYSYHCSTKYCSLENNRLSINFFIYSFNIYIWRILDRLLVLCIRAMSCSQQLNLSTKTVVIDRKDLKSSGPEVFNI